MDKLLQLILLGLKAPYPAELEPEYMGMDEGDQLDARRKWLRRQYGWGILVGALLVMNVIKWTWEIGLLTVFGLSAGYTPAGDFQALSKNVQITAQLSIAKELRDRYEEKCELVSPQDRGKRVRVLDEIERLQLAYVQVEPNRTRYPDPGC